MIDYRIFFLIITVIAAVSLIPAFILSTKIEYKHPMRKNVYGNTSWATPKDL